MKRFLLPVILLGLAGCVRNVPAEPVKVITEPVPPKTVKKTASLRGAGASFTKTLWELCMDRKNADRNTVPVKISLSFMEDGLYRGRAGEVLFYGQYVRSAGNRIRISSGITKEELYPEDEPVFRKFMKAFSGADSFRIREDRLMLMQKEKIVLKFQKAGSMEL